MHPNQRRLRVAKHLLTLSENPWTELFSVCSIGSWNGPLIFKREKSALATEFEKLRRKKTLLQEKSEYSIKETWFVDPEKYRKWCKWSFSSIRERKFLKQFSEKNHSFQTRESASHQEHYNLCTWMKVSFLHELYWCDLPNQILHKFHSHAQSSFFSMLFCLP